MKDFPISELRIIRVYHKDSAKAKTREHSYMMHQSQVDTFVKAQVKLYYESGNPHIEDPKRVINLWMIEGTSIETDTESYWWCTVDLMRNNDPNGAQLNQEKSFVRLWTHPDLLEREVLDRLEDASEYDFD